MKKILLFTLITFIYAQPDIEWSQIYNTNNYDEIRNIFNDIDMDNITPLEALIKLSDLKEKFKEKG